MKFSQMKYERPDAEQLKAELNGLTEKLKAAKSYTEAKELFLAEEKLNKHISTLANLAHIRHTIDTRDAFYDGEMKFWNKVDPELEECQQGWTQAMLESPYRKDFAEEYGNLMFLKAEIKCKTFSPVIIEELQKENELQEYTIVAVLKTDIQKLSFNRTVFADDEDFLSFQKELLAQPLYHDPAFIPGAGHRLLTLVTCSYEWDNARTVVVAVQK